MKLRTAGRLLLPALFLTASLPGAAQSQGGERAAPRLEQVPANLTYNTAEARRSLKITNKTLLRSAKNRNKVLASQAFDLEILETQERRRENYRLYGVTGKTSFVTEVGGRSLVRWTSAHQVIRDSIFEFRCDATGKLVTVTDVKYSKVEEFMVTEAHKMRFDVVMSYQAMALSAPNREVKPGESWIERVQVKGGRNPQSVFLVLKCTYLGSKTLRDRTEAVVKLEGEVKLTQDTKKPLFRRPRDVVKGQAIFDVTHGFLTRVDLALTDDFQVDEIAVHRTIDMALVRVPGNIYKIHAQDEE